MEDIVDAYGFASAVSVHKATATLLETVYHVAEHCVVYIRVRHVVEVAAKDARLFAVAHLVGHHGGLSSPDDHSKCVVAVDGVDERVGLNVLSAVYHFACLVECAVETSGFEMCVNHLYLLAVDVDVCPHGTIVCLLKFYCFRSLYRVAAEDDHVGLAYGMIREIVFVDDSVLVVAHLVVVLLYTEYVHMLFLHFGENVVGYE